MTGSMSAVVIHTDGACKGNPGPGGWGALIEHDGSVVELSGGEHATTNNRMEMTAVIRALETLAGGGADVDLYTDSQYVKNGIETWIHGWKRNGWRTADKKPVKNVELWQRLAAASAPHKLHWAWVKGHSGHVENERADTLARAEIAKLRGS